MAPNPIEVDLFLSHVLDTQDIQPSREQLDLFAGSLLVPEEHRRIRSTPCPACGHGTLRVRHQKTRNPSLHPEPDRWPFLCPAGDEVHVACTACGSELQFLFWFRE